MHQSLRRVYLATTALVVVQAFSLHKQSSWAACAPDPVADGGTVVCSGTDADGFSSSSNDLTIRIEDGAVVSGGGDVILSTGSGLKIENWGRIVGSLQQGFDYAELINHGEIIYDNDEITGIRRFGSGEFSIINNGSMTNHVDSGVMINMSGHGRAENHGNINADGVYSWGIQLNFLGEDAQDFYDNTFQNTGTISVTGRAFVGSGIFSVSNEGILHSTENAAVYVSGNEISQSYYSVDFVNTVDGVIATDANDAFTGNPGVRLTNQGLIEGNVTLSGIYRSIGGVLQGNLTFESTDDTFLISLDVNNAIPEISGTVTPGDGLDAAGYTTTGKKNISLQKIGAFELFAVEADGELSEISIESDDLLNTTPLRLFGNGTIINNSNIYNSITGGDPHLSDHGAALNIKDAALFLINKADLVSEIGIHARYGAKEIINTGTITAIEAGIYSKRASGMTVINEGTISAQGSIGTGAVVLTEGYSNYAKVAGENQDLFVLNSGLVETTNRSSGTLYIYHMNTDAKIEIHNTGIIKSHGADTPAIFSDTETNLYLKNSGSIVTYGSDSHVLYTAAAMVEIVNSGLIQAEERGGSALLLSGQTASILNSGTIAASAGHYTLRCWHICFNDLGVVVDVTKPVAGIMLQTTNAHITNEANGIISSDRYAAYAIMKHELSSIDGQTIIVNHGLIQGGRSYFSPPRTGDLDFAGAIRGAGGVEWVENFGSIVGRVDLLGGNDQFIIRGMGSVDGVVDAGLGSDTLIVDIASDRTIDLDQYLSFEIFEKYGTGTLDLSGSAAFDSFSLFGGSVNFSEHSNVIIGELEIGAGSNFAVNGTVHSDIQVAPGALLYGSGIIHGSVQNRGVISPGNSPGILTIVGDYEQTSTGVLSIEIVGGSLSPQAGVDYDRLAVTGQADLDGVLDLHITGLVASGQTYDILTATDVIAGDFASVSWQATPGFLVFSGDVVSDASISAIPDNVYRATISRQLYNSVAVGANETAVANALFAAIPAAIATPSSSMAHVLTGVDHLSAADARDLYQTAGGAFYGSLMTAQQDLGASFARSIHDRLDNDRAGGWLQGFSHWGTDGDDDTVVGADIKFAGVNAGLDFKLSENFVAGLAVGFGTIDVTGKNGIGTSDGDAWQTAIYAKFSKDRFAVTTTLGYGETDFDSTRYIRYGAAIRTVESDFSSKTYLAGVEASYRVDAAGLAFTPLAGLSLVKTKANAFSEDGADPLRLQIADLNKTASRAYAGVHVTSALGGGFRPWLRAIYSHQLSDNDPVVSQTFIGGGPQFDVWGRKASDSAALIGAGLDWTIFDAMMFRAAYDGMFRGDIKYHGLQGRFLISF